MGRAFGLALGFALGLLATGCGSRCKDVAAVRTKLTTRTGAPNRGADVQVTIPLARANALIAELLQQQPLTVPLEVPDLGPVQITTHPLTATVREVKLLPGAPGRVRFAVRLDIDDPDEQVTSISAIAEIEPVLTRETGAAQLSIGIGPENVLSLKPGSARMPPRSSAAPSAAGCPASSRTSCLNPWSMRRPASSAATSPAPRGRCCRRPCSCGLAI